MSGQGNRHGQRSGPRRGGRRRRRRGWNRRLHHRFGPESLLLVGHLKVGKTTVFSWLVGREQQQVDYPGTGMQLASGKLPGERFTRLVDAPGVHSLQDRSEDAFVVRDLLVRQRVGGVVLVMDAKNPRRGLALALQLAETELPVVVALNMADEALQRGVEVDAEALSALLGVPVVSTVAVEGRGLGQLRRSLDDARPIRLRLELPEPLRPAAERIRELLAESPVSAPGLTYQLLADLPRAHDVLDDHVDSDVAKAVIEALKESRGASTLQPDIALTEAEHVQAESAARSVVRLTPPARTRFADRLAVWSRRPASGIALVVLVLALVYLFVGWLGATVLVDLLEGQLFGEWLLPWLEGLVERFPATWVRELLIGPFGLITVGVVLPVGIVLPVLATFFLAFAVLEDSGYLPRMSLLLDRALRRIGLTGKGLVPLVMGFSCVTMAVLTTRMLDSRKQRLIATLLLVLAAPCAPLLGVMMVLLGRLGIGATLLTFGLIFFQFGLVGWLANRILPGRRPDFLLELPPLRAPRLRNTLTKTGHRLYWFLREAIPYFVLGTLVLYCLDQLGLIDDMRDLTRPVLVRFVGLPPESADVFLMSFVRREAGAALLVQQAMGGAYDGVQAVVTLLVMTLMIPCVNTLLVMFKERGLVAGSAILVFVMTYSLLFGALVNQVLRALGVTF